jgi:hypothetical protein
MHLLMLLQYLQSGLRGGKTVHAIAMATKDLQLNDANLIAEPFSRS